MSEVLEFPTREAFREWLSGHHGTSGGVWLLFGKKGGPKTLSAAEALEEALCFGWIDGQMKSLGDTAYRKYFARRAEKSSWSAKNRALAEELVGLGKMAQPGLDAMERARRHGTWNETERESIRDDQISELGSLIIGFEPAYTNFLAMPASSRRTYAALYLDAKADATRKARLERIIDRLNRNLKPM